MSRTSRIDTIVESNDHIYIFEFKIGTSEQALEQIEKMKYYEAYMVSPKNIILAGIGIDPSIRNIVPARTKKLKGTKNLSKH